MKSVEIEKLWIIQTEHVNRIQLRRTMSASVYQRTDEPQAASHKSCTDPSVGLQFECHFSVTLHRKDTARGKNKAAVRRLFSEENEDCDNLARPRSTAAFQQLQHQV